MQDNMNKKFHLSLLNIIETVDKNEEQLKELIKKSIFETAEIPDDEKENAVKMYTLEFLQMRKNIVDSQNPINNNDSTVQPGQPIRIC